MPSLTRGHVGKVTNDLGINGVGLPYKNTFTLTKVFCTNLVSDMPHLINSSKHSKVDDSTSPGNGQNL